MDPSLLCTDDQALLTPDPTDTDVDSLCPLHSPTNIMLSTYETVSDLCEIDGNSTETLSNISKSIPQEKSKNSDFRSDLEHFSEFSPDDGFRVCSHFGSSKPLLPSLHHYSPDLSSTLSTSSTDIRQEQVSFISAVRENSLTQPSEAMSFTSEALIKPVVPEPLSSHSFSPESSQATCLSRSLSHQSDNLESDTALAAVSELYIFESETQDFILSSNTDTQEITCPEYQPLSQTGVKKPHTDCNTHVLMNDSDNMVAQCHHSSTEEQILAPYESHVSQHARLESPATDACEAGLMPVNDAGEETVEVTKVTNPQQSDSPTELWLDACQYLAAEDTEDKDVFDKNHHSVVKEALTDSGDWSFSPVETQVSGYSMDGSEWIGWSSDDTKGWGPPVERWSSVDSWASALSDWTDIIAAPPEDFTAAFTEIGAEIDALTQALAEVNTHLDTETSTKERGQEPLVKTNLQPSMGVQDQPLVAQNIPEGSVLSGQTFLFLSLEAPGPELQDTEGTETLRDSIQVTQLQEEPEEICHSESSSSHQHSMGSTGAMLASPGGFESSVAPVSTSSTGLDLLHFGGFLETLEMDNFISNEEDSFVLNITEDTDLEGQKAPEELTRLDEPFGGEVCKVTDDQSAAQSGFIAKQEAKRSCGPAEVDREGTECSTDPRFLSTHTLTNWHVQDGDLKPGHHINVPTHVSSDTLQDFDGACQLEPLWGSPKFIMPLAPLGIGSSLVCQTSGSLAGDQTCSKRILNNNRDLSCGHIQPCTLLPAFDGISDKQSLEGDEDLVDKKEITQESLEKSSSEEQLDPSTKGCVTARKSETEEINDLSRELSNLAVVPAEHFIISKKDCVAYITLDLNDPFVSRVAKTTDTDIKSGKAEKMPHKTHKSTSEGKTRSKKDKSSSHHHGAQGSKKQENTPHNVSAQQVCKLQETYPLISENHARENTPVLLEDKEVKLVIDTGVANEKAPNKSHSKKKKKHTQATTGVRSVVEPLVEVENGAKPKTTKGKIDMFEAKLEAKAGKTPKDSDKSQGAVKTSQKPEVKASKAESTPHHAGHKDQQPKSSPSPPNDDIIKRRRLSGDKFGKIVGLLESKLPKPDVSIKAKGEEVKTDGGATRKKAYSEVVKQNAVPVEEPKVVKSIQAASVSGDPQSLCLWCQFTAVFTDYTVTWSKDSTVLATVKRSAGDESRVSLTISNTSNKDLGKYQCQLTSSQGSLTLEYLLTYEVLSEMVIPPSPKTITSAPVEFGSEEEDVRCSRLLFKEDFLSEQFFGENQPASIITEKVHFGEGMHRRAFRTKLQAGQIPLLLPGHPCVLKVHNSISYGTKNNDELIQKNFSLAVEECQVQNTAREYIKAYTTAAQSVESFGEVPEIIPIYLVHRPSNDIPYATLEEELIGDFVKYSVKDGKEINLMRRDSEAGQKCCAFQHWVYHNTEGNLLVTDMQGVGMRLTDVGIATCKKGHKGFKGNCATSFIDQFKALHQCNKYCEILGLKSLQPKPKKPASAPKPKPQPAAAPKKKTFGPTVKGKS